MRHILLVCGLAWLMAGNALAGETRNAVKTAKMLRCGVSTGIAGFSEQDATGRWRGLDVDFCRAVAAAAAGEPRMGRPNSSCKGATLPTYSGIDTPSAPWPQAVPAASIKDAQPTAHRQSFDFARSIFIACPAFDSRAPHQRPTVAGLPLILR